LAATGASLPSRRERHGKVALTSGERSTPAGLHRRHAAAAPGRSAGDEPRAAEALGGPCLAAREKEEDER
jgi:hypothetical protein